jgi:hypothetical protein
VPERPTVCGLVAALSVKVRVPATEPVAAGENDTPTVQCPPAARLAPQLLLVIANGPDVAMDVIESAKD